MRWRGKGRLLLPSISSLLLPSIPSLLSSIPSSSSSSSSCYPRWLCTRHVDPTTLLSCRKEGQKQTPVPACCVHLCSLSKGECRSTACSSLHTHNAKLTDLHTHVIPYSVFGDIAVTHRHFHPKTQKTKNKMNRKRKERKKRKKEKGPKKGWKKSKHV